MINLDINGTLISLSPAEPKKLMDYLREDLGLTSVKDGCSAGACGTCTVIVDGVAQKSCVSVASLEPDEDDFDDDDEPVATDENPVIKITTVEGLSEREKAVYDYAFAEAGAVQCGFCTPGMVLAGKALIDKNPSPTDQEIKLALRRNICRCTGYVKIIEAIQLAAKLLREDLPIPQNNASGKLGSNIHRIDAREKTLGTGEFVDDVTVPGMIYGKALRTQYPRAKVLKIDTRAAKNHPDAECIITAKDVPGNNKLGHLVKDWDALIAEGDTTRYVGDAIALVAAKNQSSLDEILSLIEVEYEELTPLTNPVEAMAEDAPALHEGGNILRHEKVTRGDAQTAIANAAFTVTQHYSTPFTEHAFMEPECAIAIYEDGGILLYSGGQGIYDDQHEIAEVLGIPNEKVRVQSKLVGGGFGGKEDMSVQHHAALLAWHTQKPVKIKFSRQESLLIHPKRHAMEMDLTTACDENGILLGMQASIVLDTGAYASLGGPVLQRACTHAAGPYNFQNVDIDGKAVYTNNPPGGAFRGFGVSQSAFAFEANLNLLAEKVGISPWEIRYRNAIRPGQSLPNGQIADESTALVECLEAVKDIYESSKYAGIASSFKNSGLGVGVPDIGRAILSVEQGKVHIRSSAACIGQGIGTVTLQTVCEVTSLPPELIVVEAPDTSRTPNSGTTTASRQTVFTGEAVRRAAVKVKQELSSGSTLADLEGKEFYGEYKGETDPMGSAKANPVSHVAYGYAAQVVILDEKGKVEKVVAAYDLGKLVNRKAAEGQIEGGIVMGLGYALTEDYPLVNSVPKVSYNGLGLWKAAETPAMETIIVEREFNAEIAHGTKGVGELATIPTAPAAQGAFYAFDGEFRTKLPMDNTPYRKAKKPKKKRVKK
ncbi:selenium-dependent xanthine dehydrogenase [Reinekea marinisedimentorum]|uniref:Selenium-dependent xanthine dehydrogenase n=1 Tax=Reinekea marinisedimentorum TaxID=230495 RepID=A0A4R3HRD7_9GAMM|nr:selenium-dependent xanthine dehydrogenase [Reinekea marinisedimentorum]TCS35667.1 selenium-dependent xanthine dehydrogenase [Reinekea marinisedimentorum]